MSEMKHFFKANVEEKKPFSKSLDELLSLSWLCQYVEHFQKPSPDEMIDIQKNHGKRVQIIAKSSSKISETCSLLTVTPIIKQKIEQKVEMPIVHKLS